jgi:peptidoglycan glycosyltransferase
VDANHRQQQLTLGQSYAYSANAAFAKIGDEMPPDVLIGYAQRFGFSQEAGKSFPFEIDTSPSQLANSVDSLYSDNMLRASTAIGQGELLATPLTIGEMALAVVNDGNLPVPYLVEAVKDPAGRVIQQHPNRQVVHGLMKPETAQTVRDMMISVVTSGTGGNASVPGMVVGGKTGTAQIGGSANPHAWFVGFAQDGEREVVIVVVIENGGEGAVAAAPIFAQMAKEALKPAGG